jgi:hypothetical protein
VPPNEDAPGTWGACRTCGVAAPEGAPRCPICGAERPLSAKEVRTAPRSLRRRLRLTGFLRTVVVVVVVVGLAYALISAVVEGPPVLVGDPLTTEGAFTIAPGNSTLISGEITGGDYVIGNYTSIHPIGTNIALAVYNSSEWDALRSGGTPAPEWSPPPSPGGRIVYSAPVTDTYYFVFSNPYPVSSHLTVEVYVTTTYESNVGGDGFG